MPEFSLRTGLLSLSMMFSLANISVASTASDEAVKTLFKQHCASCHGLQRLGGIGPALLPENLKRLKPAKAVKTVANGAPATQMPAFSALLKETEIQQLVDYIYTPLAELPDWDIDAIRDSRIIYYTMDSLPAVPVHSADPLNIFMVVEAGDHHISVLDGDKFEVINRFKSRFALHGGLKYSPDGRFVYMASRDGWISKYDLHSLKMVAEIRAGINTRNVAVSGDGRYLMVGNYLPHSLVLLDAQELKPLKVIPVEDDSGNSSRVSAVYDAAPRSSFIAALKDITEVWEISYADDPPYYGFVHDYRDEGVPDQEPFPVRRIRLDDYLDDFFFDQSYVHLMGAARNAKNGQVVDLDLGRKTANMELNGLPHLGSGITWSWQDKQVMATPNLKSGEVSVIDMQDWNTIKRIETLGPGFFMRSHENSPYAWVDTFFGPNKDAMQVIDKRSLEIVKTLRPVPGKTSAHIEFDRDGSHALLSIWEMDGLLIVYDANSLEEVKRLRMKKPSGKYNVYNKISRSEGTSH